ncbi:hypothetical protein AB0F57_38025 [Streptomyces tanashiensis]|uniref:hypothetical protein n=1 Tax=Streptomyces tanashiensis TaxID=67367 RepID=UPI0033F8062E
MRTDILAFDLELGQWYVCWSSPYATNPAGQYWIGVNYNINRFCNPPGGGRWYANNTLAEAKNIAGSWRGGWLASGNEWVGPAFAATKAPEQPKVSAREAIEQGEVRAGSPTGPRLPLSYFEGKTAAPTALAPRSSRNAPTLAASRP